jgi:hypothetical protein
MSRKSVLFPRKKGIAKGMDILEEDRYCGLGGGLGGDRDPMLKEI